MQLIDINDKEGEISYNVNLFSEAVTLKDILENKTFVDIDFSELDHDYTITNIQNSWDNTTGLDLINNLTTSSAAYEVAIGLGNTNVLKYPFVNWKGDWSIDSSGNIELLNLEQVFRPFIQVRYLIKKIIEDAGFTYTSAFFDTSDFKKLFMDFNWGSTGRSATTGVYNNPYDPVSGTTYPLIYSTTSYQNFQLTDSSNFNASLNYDVINHRFEALHNNAHYNISYSLLYLYAGGATGLDMRWVHKDSGGNILNTHNVQTWQGSSAAHYTSSFSAILQSGDTLQAEFKSDLANTYYVGVTNFGGSFQSTITASVISIQSNLLQYIRGELGQWEFLKGIFTMFNLVVLKEDEVLRIEPYADIFITSSAVTPTQHNWTDKVDISEINLKPLELKRKIKFTYEDDDSDYVLSVYKKATNGYLYGTKNLDGSTAMPNQVSNLTGEEEIIATPFAPTIIRPATDLFPADLTIPHIYSGNDDGTEFEDFENLPRILYNLGVKSISGKTYYVPAQNGVAAISAEDEFLQFAHITEIPTTTTTPSLDYNFGECQLFPPIGATPTNNLYQVYYSPYYDELYNPDTRVMTLKVNLTPADIQNFRFYDTVVIKNREYRVNKIEYKPNTLAKVEFILIP